MKIPNEDQLVKQLENAAEKAVEMFFFEQPAPKEVVERLEKTIKAIYLSGASQAVSFLVRTDGGVLPQQVERALQIAGDRIGLTLVRPRK